jgi:calcium-dependent protein kinase
MWMLGVCLYLMLSGRFPIEAESAKAAVPLIRKGDWSFTGGVWGGVSSDCKSLVQALLQARPMDRISADEALQHPWFSTQTRRTLLGDQEPNLQLLRSNLEKFASKQRLEKAVLAIAVRNRDESQLKDLKKIFSALDQDQDGVLSVEEVERGLELAEMSLDVEMDAELEHIAAKNGRVTYSDFLAMMLDKSALCEENTLKEAFGIFDRNRDGCLDVLELSAVLGKGADAEGIVQEFGDGDALDFRGFQALLSHMAQS